MTRAEVLEQVAMSMLGTPYLWGGKSRFTGLDCSGFVCEVLKSVGLLQSTEDLSAQALYSKFLPKKLMPTGSGYLVFFADYYGVVDHVGIVLNTANNLMIEAGGGDHTVTTVELAKTKGACVRVRPFSKSIAVIPV